MEIIFQKSGGVILRTERYACRLDNASMAARAFREFLEWESTDYWEDNEIDDLRNYHNPADCVHTITDAVQIIDSKVVSTSWHNICEFYQKLGCKPTF